VQVALTEVVGVEQHPDVDRAPLLDL
jgi:hypothetical protein